MIAKNPIQLQNGDDYWSISVQQEPQAIDAKGVDCAISFGAGAYVQLLTMEGRSLMMILGVACPVFEPMCNYVMI